MRWLRAFQAGDAGVVELQRCASASPWSEDGGGLGQAAIEVDVRVVGQDRAGPSSRRASRASCSSAASRCRWWVHRAAGNSCPIWRSAWSRRSTVNHSRRACAGSRSAAGALQLLSMRRDQLEEGRQAAARSRPTARRPGRPSPCPTVRSGSESAAGWSADRRPRSRSRCGARSSAGSRRSGCRAALSPLRASHASTPALRPP